MTTVDQTTRPLILSCQGLVKAIAVRVHSNSPRHVELDDLIGYGELGLAEAARDFDPQRGVQFSTFAYYRIRGAIFDGLAKITWHDKLRYQQFVYERNADEALLDEADRAEADDGSLEADAARFRRITGKLFVAHLATNSGGDGDEECESAIEDTAAVAPSVLAARREHSQVLHELIKTLPPDAQQLVYTMYFEGQSLTEASQKLGISKSWASRLHAKTLERLANSLRRIGVEL